MEQINRQLAVGTYYVRVQRRSANTIRYRTTSGPLGTSLMKQLYKAWQLELTLH